MKRHRVFLLSVGLWLCWAGLVRADAVPPWKLGYLYRVKVEVPDRSEPKSGDPKSGEAKPDEKFKEYILHAAIRGTEKINGHLCWKVEFGVSGKERLGGSFRFRVSLDAKDGWPRKAFSFKDYRPMPIQQVGDARLLTVAPEGIPLDFLPLLGPMEAKSGDSTLTVAREGDSLVQTVTLTRGMKKELVIRQEWKEGATWWDKYERYRDGQLDLRAWYVAEYGTGKKPPVAQETPKPPPQSPKPAVKPKAGKTAKQNYPPFVDIANDPLRNDPRLQVKVKMKLRNPRAHHILSRLEKATGLTFSADENVDAERPVFAALEWNTRACNVMDSLARSPTIQGKWKKVEGGYQLIGKPRDKEAEPFVDPDPERITSEYLFWAVSGSGVLVVLMGYLAHYLYQKKKSTAKEK
jgi:hypothetical protein